MAQSAMQSHLTHSFEIFTEFSIDLVAGHLEIHTISRVFLSIQEPQWDIMFQRFSDHIRHLVDLLFSQLSGSELRMAEPTSG